MDQHACGVTVTAPKRMWNAELVTWLRKEVAIHAELHAEGADRLYPKTLHESEWAALLRLCESADAVETEASWAVRVLETFAQGQAKALHIPGDIEPRTMLVPLSEVERIRVARSLAANHPSLPQWEGGKL